MDQLIRSHDARIPRRSAPVRPGRKGVVLSIDPYSDDELYELDNIEDSIAKTIVLESERRHAKEELQEKNSAQEKETEAAVTSILEPEQPSTSTEEHVIAPDLINQQRADKYLEGVEPESDLDNAETISSTSTADYDREEAQDLLDKISSCHSALATHFNRMN